METTVSNPTFDGYTLQEAFDKAVTHLAQQRCRSTLLRTEAESIGIDDPVFCAYRGRKGRSCVVGALIPDILYSKELEGGGVSTLPKGLVRKLLPWEEYGRAAGFLERMQDIHDCAEARGRDAAKGIAADFGKVAYDFGLKEEATARLGRVVWHG